MYALIGVHAAGGSVYTVNRGSVSTVHEPRFLNIKGGSMSANSKHYKNAQIYSPSNYFKPSICCCL